MRQTSPPPRVSQGIEGLSIKVVPGVRVRTVKSGETHDPYHPWPHRIFPTASASRTKAEMSARGTHFFPQRRNREVRVLVWGRRSHVNGGRDVRPAQKSNLGLDVGPWAGPCNVRCRENWRSTCKRVELQVYLTSYSEISETWVKHLKMKPETIKF